MHPSGSRGLSSWKTFCGFTGSAATSAWLGQQAPPALDLARDLVGPGAVGLLLEQRQQRAQRVAGVAGEVDLHRVADAEHARVEVDLHAARLARLGQPLGVREAGADHQQRVAALHQRVARLRPEQADRAGDEGQVVGQHVAAVERLGDPGAEPLGDLLDLGGGLAGALADQDRDPLAGVEHLGGAREVGVVREHPRLRHRPAREDRAVRARRRLGLLFLQVGRDDHAGDRARRARDLDGAVDQVRDLPRRHRDLDELARDVLEQRAEVDLLLVAGAERQALLLADDRDDRLMVELGVVEPVEEVDRARPGGREADADVAAELRVRAGHERRQFLVRGLDELDRVAVLVKAAEDPVDAVAGIAVDTADAVRRGAARGCARRPFETWARRYPEFCRATRVPASTQGTHVRGRRMTMLTFAPRLVRVATYALMAAVALHVLHGVGGVDLGLPAGVFDDWLYNAVLVGAALVCAARAVLVREERVAWALIAAGLISWSAADIYYTAVLAKLEEPPYPSISDLGWLLFYPAFWIAIVVLMRRRIREFHASLWLDGIVAGLAMAACAVALVLPPILAMSLEGDAPAVAVNLAYPAGDLLLIALLLGALALTGWRPDRSITLIGIAVFLSGVADSAISTQSPTEATRRRPGLPRCGPRRPWWPRSPRGSRS